MYLVGAAHPNKERTVSILERLARDETPLVSDAEVLQEILHRYTAIDRMDAIQPAFDALFGIVDDVFPVTADDLIRAKSILLSTNGLSARDAVHTAIMTSHEAKTIFSFDARFDLVSFVTRIS